MFAVQAALMAVYERDVAGSGVGQVIDVSLFESLFRLLDSQVVGYDQLGLVKGRMGNRMAEDSPRNAYRTADGEYVAISAGSQRTYSRLAEAVGDPAMSNDPRFATNEARCENADVLDDIVARWFAGLTLAEAMERLEASDVVAGPVYDVARIFADPQYAARDAIVSVPDADLGQIRMQGIIPKFSRTPGEIRHTGGAKGEAGRAFFRDEVGVDATEWEALVAQRVV
jgi:crotonobetainyl-CoA:carnitine CoA-transferase CaiB-like acyl-CoA transferase